MMNTQQSSFPGRASAAQELHAGSVVLLGHHGGEVRVLSGRVWLTSPDDLGDHVLDAGETFCVDHDGPTLVEAWDEAAPAVFAWRPRSLADRARGALSRGRAVVLHNSGVAATAAIRQHRTDDSDQRQRPCGLAYQAGGCAAGAA